MFNIRYNGKNEVTFDEIINNELVTHKKKEDQSIELSEVMSYVDFTEYRKTSEYNSDLITRFKQTK